MILNDNVYEIESTLTKSKKFTIKASPKAFKILSNNLYSNKIRAIIRELSCNAYDSHIAAKNDEPFIVHLPDSIDSHFYIRDYGTGLCEEDILNLYTTYFDSNKTNSNEYVGALGLGSKSPFSYTDSFVVESYYNGIKNTYLVYIDEDDTPSISKLSEEKTNEKNGLSIKFSVKPNDVRNFKYEAKYVLSAFEKRPIVYCDNNILDLGRKIKFTEKGYFLGCLDEYYSGTYAFMGNILYPIMLDKLDLDYNIISFLQRQPIYINFNIGELDITPSREHLSYNKQTIEKLSKTIVQKVEDIIKDKVDPINSMNDTIDMILKFNELPNHLRPLILERLDYTKFSEDIKAFYKQGADKFYLSSDNLMPDMISDNVKQSKICKTIYKYDGFISLSKFEGNIFDKVKNTEFYISFSNKEDYMYKSNKINNSLLISVRLHKRTENDKNEIIKILKNKLHINEFNLASKLKYISKEIVDSEKIKYKNDMAICYNLTNIKQYIQSGLSRFNYDLLDHFSNIFTDNKIDNRQGIIFVLPICNNGVIGNDGKILSEEDKKFYMFCLSSYIKMNKKGYRFKVILCRNKAIENIKKYNIPHFCYFISRIMRKNKKWKNDLLKLYSNKGNGQYNNLIKILAQFKDNEKLLDKDLIKSIKDLPTNDNVTIDYFSEENLKKLYKTNIKTNNFNLFQKYNDFSRMIEDCSWGSYVWKKHENCFVDMLNLIYLKGEQ